MSKKKKLSIKESFLGIAALKPIGSVKEAEAATIPPPAMGGQQGGQNPQQAMLQRREQMKQHEGAKREAIDLIGDLTDIANQLRASMGSSKTKQAQQDIQQAMQVLSKLSSLSAQMPQLESKQIFSEDHGDQLEKQVQQFLQVVNQHIFSVNVAIQSGAYDEAVRHLAQAEQPLQQAMQLLQQRAKQTGGQGGQDIPDMTDFAVSED